MSNTDFSSYTQQSELFFQTKGSGIPLLLIHGIISDSSFFEPCMSVLSRSYQTICYDRRGYGKSVRQAYTDYSVHTQARDAAEVLGAVKAGPAYILGNSAGGLVGLELALHYPQLVKGLVIVEPSLGYEEQERLKLLAWNEELNEYARSGRHKQALPAFTRITGAPEGSSSAPSLMALKQTYQNLSAFLTGELNMIQHYLPPAEALRQITVPRVIAVTERGRESIFATSSVSAAKHLGWPLIHLPGYHNVAKDMPLDFSLFIHGVLSAMENGYFTSSPIE